MSKPEQQGASCNDTIISWVRNMHRPCRATQIQNQVRGFLKQVDATLEIEAAPSEAGEERDPGAELMQRSACKDATPSPPLRSLLAAHSSSRRHHTHHHPSPTHSNPSSILNSDGLSAGIASTSSQDSLQDGAEVHAAAPRSAAASPSASGESQHGTANGQGTCSSGRQNVLAPVESPWVANEGGGVGRPPSPLGSSASTSRRSSLDDEPLNGSLNLIDGPLEVCVDAQASLSGCQQAAQLCSSFPFLSLCPPFPLPLLRSMHHPTGTWERAVAILSSSDLGLPASGCSQWQLGSLVDVKKGIGLPKRTS